jgi:hypothetical protein
MMSEMVSLVSFVFCMVMFLPAESYLLYVNYLARVKYKEQFKEQTRLWLKFDKRGLTVLALILRFVVMTIVMVILAIFSELFFFAWVCGMVCGLVWANAFFDDKTLKSKLPCIETICSELGRKKKCLNCAVPDEYDVSLFSHVRIKKKKTTNR